MHQLLVPICHLEFLQIIASANQAHRIFNENYLGFSFYLATKILKLETRFNVSLRFFFVRLTAMTRRKQKVKR